MKKEDYIMQHCSAEDPLLTELRRKTYLRMINPEMVSGHYQGKLLEMFSCMIRPERILEIGTFTGYSTICLAKGLAPEGRLHTIDNNDEIMEFARNYICKSQPESKIVMHTGEALDIIPTIESTFDLVFIDAEKTEYLQYYNLVLPKTRSGGIIIADNVLWYNKVYQDEVSNDRSANHLREFNKVVQMDSRVENLIVPARDGLMLIRKK